MMHGTLGAPSSIQCSELGVLSSILHSVCFGLCCHLCCCAIQHTQHKVVDAEWLDVVQLNAQRASAGRHAWLRFCAWSLVQAYVGMLLCTDMLQEPLMPTLTQLQDPSSVLIVQFCACNTEHAQHCTCFDRKTTKHCHCSHDVG